MPVLDQTHDPRRQSWVDSANASQCHFPIQNLPLGIFSTMGTAPRAGIAIGDQVLDLAVLDAAGLLGSTGRAGVFDRPELNGFMGLGRHAWRQVRQAVSDLLAADSPRLRDNGALRQRALIPMAKATLHLPMFVRSFTDFYASREHATNVGALFRGVDNALMPNWLHLPVGYNGRASTVVVSGTEVRRPLGQTLPPGQEAPEFGPSRRLDFELELGAVVGVPSTMGEPLGTAEAFEMIFGYVLLNDWSARDIQTWEYQPLGPFQSKAFATTISPWIVTSDAMEPFRVPTPPRAKPLLPYLGEATPNNLDIELEVTLRPGGATHASTITRTNSRHLYYSLAQQLTHHAVGGCAMCTGDLLGSGTISGSGRDSLGSLVEMTLGGKQPIVLGDGSQRTFLEDGDTLTLTGWCEREGHRIGFGECAGTILTALVRSSW